jgi:cytochrome b6-f complex iron-sulfur subunit
MPDDENVNDGADDAPADDAPADDTPAEEPAQDAAAEEKPAAAERPARTPAVRAPAAAAAGAGAGGRAVVVAAPRAVGPAFPPVSRRTVLKWGFWAGLFASLAAIGATIINMLWPRGVQRFGGQFVIGTIEGDTVTVNGAPLAPGAKQQLTVLLPNEQNPLENLEAKIFMVRFDEAQASRNPGAQAGAVLALWRKCPHLGCTVPFNATFSFADPLNGETYAGWFRCPCHGSTYSDSGRRVFGPAPRSMDAFALSVDDGGNLVVDLDTVYSSIEGNADKGILPGA